MSRRSVSATRERLTLSPFSFTQSEPDSSWLVFHVFQKAIHRWPDYTQGMATAPDLALERGLPASVEAERSILGAILLDNPSYNEAAEKLTAEDFSLDSHRRIYAAWRS